MFGPYIENRLTPERDSPVERPVRGIRDTEDFCARRASRIQSRDGPRGSGNMNESRRIDCDAARSAVIREARRVDQFRAIRAEARDEIAAGTKAQSVRKSGRRRCACDPRLTGRVDRNRIRRVDPSPAEIACPDNRRAGRIQLQGEGIGGRIETAGRNGCAIRSFDTAPAVAGKLGSNVDPVR